MTEQKKIPECPPLPEKTEDWLELLCEIIRQSRGRRMKSLTQIRKDNEPSDRQRADYLATTYGKSLVGRTVWTPAIGDYSGGEAVITEVGHDPEAPEIVFLVNHPVEGEMGIFDYEQVRLMQ